MSTTTSATPRPMATGGMLFAATIMVLGGLFQLLLGIAAIAKDEILVGTPNYFLRLNTTGWGWIHLLIGIAVMVTGFFVFTAAPWARYTGIALVALQALGSFAFVPYFPFWTLTILGLDIFIIWALAAGPSTRTHWTDDDYMMREDASYDPAARRAR